MKILILAMFTVTLLCGCAPAKKNAYVQCLEGATKVCLKNICGYQKIVKLDLDFNIDDVYKSKAVAVVEFINMRGGYERTNVPIFLYGSKLAEVSALIDEGKLFEDAMRPHSLK